MRTKILLHLFFFIAIAVFLNCAGQNDFPVLSGDYLGQNPPGMTPEIFAPGIISHGFHEHNLTISPDGDEILFSCSSRDHSYYAIIQVKRNNNVWSSPEIAPFSGNYSDMGPRFSPDGKKLYFSSRRPRDGEVEIRKDFDIWFVEKRGETWSEPVNLGRPVNTDYNEYSPSFSTNGNIYFHYWEEKGSESDICYSVFENGGYQEPVKLEYGISTEHYDGGPFIAPDESYILFQAIRPESFLGNTNIYISFRNSDNTWSNPANIGKTINSSGYPIQPMISPDGKYLFFSTNTIRNSFSYSGKSYLDLIDLYKSHLNGYGTIYWVDAKIIENLKPDYLK
jgi:Tol biopolymer transport system component